MAKLGGSVTEATGLDALSLTLSDNPDAACALMHTSKLKAAAQRLTFRVKEARFRFKIPLRLVGAQMHSINDARPAP